MAGEDEEGRRLDFNLCDVFQGGTHISRARRLMGIFELHEEVVKLVGWDAGAVFAVNIQAQVEELGDALTGKRGDENQGDVRELRELVLDIFNELVVG